MVAAAGNSDNTGTPNYPAAFSNVIGVASTDQSDQRATFSNWGNWVKVAASGTGIRTTNIGNSYAYLSGTSYSAGFVAGVAGLIVSKYPSISATDATNAILVGVDPISPDHPIGSGRVNVFKALQAAAPTAVFTVSKVYSGGNTAPVSVTLTCTSGTITPSATQLAVPGSPAAFTVTGFSGGSTCSASEAVPAGYTETDNCANVAIAIDGTPSCTITNTLNSASFSVNKVYSPSGPTTSVPISVNCSSGAPSPASGAASPSTPFTTTVTGFDTSGTTCTATETVPAGYAETDNCASVSITVGGTPSCTITNSVQADLSVMKSASPTPALMLNVLTYTVTVNNGGPSGATGVTLTDTLPGAVTFGSATPSQGSCSQAAGIVTCGLGGIPNGGNATVSIIVTPTTGNPVTNNAVVSGNEPDPNSTNNSVTITTPALWQCTKSDSTVVYRGWPTPAGDDDCDGFTTAIENFVGTDPLVACGLNAWPPDINNDGRANISDVLKYSPVFNTTGPGLPYLKHYDLNGDNRINISDVLKFSPFFNQSCAP
jgi:uncharacterized repeat protein (TIGR01451 family)